MMLSRSGLVTIIFITLVLLLVGYFTVHIADNNDTRDSDAAQTLGSGDESSFESFSGEEVSLEDLEGKIRVVNSWASWSPYSKSELPALAALAREYEDQDVAVVAVNRGEDSIRAERYLEQFSDLSPLIILIDPEDSYYHRMDGKAMPETLIFDKKGNLVEHMRGVMTAEVMREKLELVLSSAK